MNGKIEVFSRELKTNKNENFTTKKIQYVKFF